MLIESAKCLQNERTKMSLKQSCANAILRHFDSDIEFDLNPFDALPSTLRLELLQRVSSYLSHRSRSSDEEEHVNSLAKLLICSEVISIDFDLFGTTGTSLATPQIKLCNLVRIFC